MTELEYFKGDELAATTWRNKYALEGESNPDDMHRRLAKEFARIESRYPRGMTEEEIYDFFKGFKYIIPGGSIMSGLGNGRPVSLSNCFVVGSPKDSYESIMQVRNQQVQLMKRRGGVGYDLSELRPRGAKVNNAANTSTGAASFMEGNSQLTNETCQEGRRGALMLSISINHPDVEEFITKKQDLTKVTGANISVKVTDKFMQAVEKDSDYLLRYPVESKSSQMNTELLEDHSTLPYNKLHPYYYSDSEGEEQVFYLKKVRARELWNTLIHCTHSTAEPGIIFESRMHNFAPDGIYPRFRMVGTNPCGEIPMGPFDSCRLIHLNLTSFVENPFIKGAYVDRVLLYNCSYVAMRLADDIVDLEIEAMDRILCKVQPVYSNMMSNGYSLNSIPDFLKDQSEEFKLWWNIRETTIQGRRAGLGFTGLADMVAMLGLKYDSDEGIKAVEDVMKIIFNAQLDCQIDMARERGIFPAWNVKEIGLSDEYGNFNFSNDWYDFVSSNYPEQLKVMARYGRRNLSWSTVAPTGTVSIMAQCSSGIEPVFLPYYKRRRKVMSEGDRVDYTDIKGEKYTEFLVIHPNFKKWCEQQAIVTDYAPEGIRRIRRADLNNEEDLNLLFKESPYYGSTAPEISWEKRVELQGIVQKYITHSISSTINLSNETTEEQISQIYMEAWKHGLKGVTVYRDGCREGILNSTKKPTTVESKDAPKRPKELEADCYLTKAKGKQFIVLVGLLEGKPYEIFTFRPLNPVNFRTHKGIITKVGKMHYSFKSEFLYIDNLEIANTNVEENAATLYSSMLLRHGVDIKYIVKTAKKVNDNISSFSSAMCRILSKYAGVEEVKGEVCPDCGSSLYKEGGCTLCKNCGWSKCN